MTTDGPTGAGKLLRDRRRDKGWSQEELARRSTVNVRTIREIEAGRSRPRAATVRALADVLELNDADRAVLLAVDSSGPSVPRQLPPAPRRFAGRERELSIMDAVLARSSASRLLLTGSGGMGKSWLALHWAHANTKRFPDGQLFVDLRGCDDSGPALRPEDAIRGFLTALGVAAERVPSEPGALTQLYHSTVQDRRMLIVVDNARDEAQVRPLLPNGDGCFMLVTSRGKLAGMLVADSAEAVPLTGLDADDARALLTRRLGPEPLAAEPEAVAEIIAGCGGLPLALAIVAAKVAMAPASGGGTALSDIAAALRDSRGRLAKLSTDDSKTEPRLVFSWSFSTVSTDAARLFRLLGLHPGPQVSIAAAASLAGVGKGQARALLSELAAANLATEPVPGRFGMHDLLRAYAVELAESTEAEAERKAARLRMLDHYLHSGFSAARLVNPARTAITLAAPEPGTVTTEPRNQDAAQRWLAGEHPVLLNIIGYSARTGHDVATWQTAWAVTDYLDRGGHWHDLAVAQTHAVAATGRLGDSAAAFTAHHNLAHAHMRLNRLDDAKQQLLRCLELGNGDDGVPRQAHARRSLAIVSEKAGELAEALEHARGALQLFQDSSDRLGHARALNAVGWLQSRLGDNQAALTACQEALERHRDIDHVSGQAASLDSLGRIHRELGEHAKAVDRYRLALSLIRQVGDGYNEAAVLDALGDTHLAAGDRAAAREAWRRALDLYTELDHHDAEAVRAKLAGTGD